MPRTLTKLASGLIHTDEFAQFIQRQHAQEAARHRHEVLALDYIRCGSGPQQGTAWWQLGWVPELRAPVAGRQRIGEIEVFIHRQSLRGLKGRCLHYQDGEVVVLK